MTNLDQLEVTVDLDDAEFAAACRDARDALERLAAAHDDVVAAFERLDDAAIGVEITPPTRTDDD